MERSITYDCSRGCSVERRDNGELICKYRDSCSKRAVYNWLEGIDQEELRDFFEVRFKNTRKAIFKNDSGQTLRKGDIVVVEATNGHDVGIITLEGPVVVRQMIRNRIEKEQHEFRKIYRKAKPLDLERWQEAIAREHHTMIRSRQIAEQMELNMKIGDVEFQGDGTKAIFYYIADERVDFRQLIKKFAEEFRIRIEMKQIGARQEAGLIGGIGVCGRALCCSSYMSDFQSITTQTARSQDLSLNPQKLAGQCSKLKCCINHEASVYLDAIDRFPMLHGPLEFRDGLAYHRKTDVLKGIMWFSYQPDGLINLQPMTPHEVSEVLRLNKKGVKPDTLLKSEIEKSPEFISAVGDEKIDRFDERNKNRGKKRRKNNYNRNKQNKN